jgi:hypothetical protein
MMHGDHDFEDCSCDPDDLENEAAPAEPFSWRSIGRDWLNAAGGLCEITAEFPYSIARALAGHQRHVERQRAFREEVTRDIERLPQDG